VHGHCPQNCVIEFQTSSTTALPASCHAAFHLARYVVRVAASISKREPRTRVLAEALLAPIQRWESRGRRSEGHPDSGGSAAAGSCAAGSAIRCDAGG
jgi:hypothetical protein